MTINVEDLTLKQIKEISDLVGTAPTSNNLQPFEIGKAYLIRTVTHINIGIVEQVGETEIVISGASWIADTGRFHECVTEGKLDEVEPFPDGLVIVGRGALIDATRWTHELPRKQK